MKNQGNKLNMKVAALLMILVLGTIFISACSMDRKEKKSKEVNEQETSVDENVVFTKDMAREYNIAVLKGPTGIGFVSAWDDSEEGETMNTYKVNAYGTADEITAGIVKNEIDIAAVPCNLASVLYNKTEGAISVVAINTLGVLEIISDDDSITSVADLKGKTIYSTGKGTTPEYTLNHILEENGLTVGKDVTVEYKSEATEVAAMLSTSENVVAMLPQPYATSVKMQNDNLKTVLSITEEWKNVSNDNELVTGVVIVRNEIINDNPEAFEQFLLDYKNSTEFVNNSDNIEESAALVEKHDLFKAEVAKRAIPDCNITFITGDEMKNYICSYLQVLYDSNPQSVGGKLPDDKFYH